MQPFIPKEIPGMPDSYGVEISVFGDKAKKYEVIDHRIVDKVYDYKEVEENGKKIRMPYLVGVHPTPFWEFNLKENDQLFVVPVGSATIIFDSRWYKICELRRDNGNKK